MAQLKKEIARAREEAKLTQGELAERVGVSHVTVYRWETGERSPKDRMKRRIAVACGVSARRLLLAEPSDPPAAGKAA